MQNKKGQVTIFIIIAVVIVVAGVLIYMFYPQIKSGFSSKEDSVSLFVRSCIEDTGKDAIYFVSQKGGYFSSPIDSNINGIPYYYFNGKNYMPSKEKIEEELSSYMNNMLTFCLQDFVNFPEVNISQGEVETRTKIKEGEIVLDVKYPLVIKKGESVSRIEEFEDIKIPVRLGIIYDAVGKIIQEQMTHEDICLSCISGIMEENELKIDLTNVDDGIIFTIIDENSKIKDVDLKFSFVNKYE